jgi:putative DNA primase/helicase
MPRCRGTDTPRTGLFVRRARALAIRAVLPQDRRGVAHQLLEDIRRTLDIKAYEDGVQYEPFVRVGGYNGRIYLDARPLPEPEASDVIERLRGFINVANEDDFRLIVSWLVSALRPGSPFPILIVNGVQGTGKSVLCRLLRSLIDPDLAMICAAPKDERDLVLAASNTWVQALDNLSDVNGFLPDALCRLASGAGFQCRDRSCSTVFRR